MCYNVIFQSKFQHSICYFNIMDISGWKNMSEVYLVPLQQNGFLLNIFFVSDLKCSMYTTDHPHCPWW